jgi:hypothetical protein
MHLDLWEREGQQGGRHVSLKVRPSGSQRPCGRQVETGPAWGSVL